VEERNEEFEDGGGEEGRKWWNNVEYCYSSLSREPSLEKNGQGMRI